MIGDIDVRTSVRLIASAPELSPCRMTSVVTGSASGAAAEPWSPARYITASASGISVSVSWHIRCVDVVYVEGAAPPRPRLEAGVEVGRRGLLEHDRRTFEAGLADRRAVDDREREALAARERPRVDAARGAVRRGAPGRDLGGAARQRRAHRGAQRDDLDLLVDQMAEGAVVVGGEGGADRVRVGRDRGLSRDGDRERVLLAGVAHV